MGYIIHFCLISYGAKACWKAIGSICGTAAMWQDPRVDVCLYFIAPHRLKAIDVEFIKKLADLVPVVPILAKV
jgi:Septin